MLAQVTWLTRGIVPGFDAEVFLVPGDRVGVLAFTNSASQAALWLSAERVAVSS
jgi:hypothetical protein